MGTSIISIMILFIISHGSILCHVHYSRNHFSQIVERNSPSLERTTPSNIVSTGFTSIVTKTPPCDKCPNGRTCVPHVQCPAHVLQKDIIECDLKSNHVGVCCQTGQNHTGDFENLKTRASSVNINNDMINIAVKDSKNKIDELLNHEHDLLLNGKDTIVSRGSVSYGHNRNFRIPRHTDLTETIDLNRKALEIALATQSLKEREGVSSRQIELGLMNVEIRSSLGRSCMKQAHCNMIPSRYRTIDGTCNNVANPLWGSALTSFARLLPPHYEDGIMVPRTSLTDGRPLTSPRIISDILIDDFDRPHSTYTLMVMQFGQFISHDLTRSIQHVYANGSSISCCTQDEQNELPLQLRHFACMPILISPNDNFYSEYSKGCMNFVRSMIVPRQDCSFGFAEQMNKITHFLDASMIYGSDIGKLSEIRYFQGGRLKVFSEYGRTLLPLSKHPNECVGMEKGFACFSAGDDRCNQMISLTTLHTLFHREHNRIADELTIINPHWNDEILFMETRRIIIAEIQHILYNEWLPLIIGEESMDQFNLKVNPTGYSSDYDPNINPSVTNEFATAAFRLHTTIDGKISIMGNKHLEEVIDIPEVMFNPSRLRFKTFFDEIINTLTSQPMQQFDASITEGLTKYMFREGNPFGFDIVSLNIQRGRDHGLRPYNDYRELIGLQKITAWEEYVPKIADKLRNLYASPDDIDLWIGGILETTQSGAVVGPTFRDIIADQFSRLRKGDRYFYEHNPAINPGHFSEDQLMEIKRITLARVICDNNDRILIVKQAPNAFILPGLIGNNYIDCDSSAIPHINLIPWKEL